jgi:RimJ/RimL family protein N-acetyltransferase
VLDGYPGGVKLAVPDPPLSDGVVVLRVPREQDLPAIEQRIADPEVLRWIGPSEQSARQFLELNRSGWAEGKSATFSICHPKDDCVGHVWVDLAGQRGGEVGYWLLPEARGKGLATRSVRLISRWALRELELPRLSLFTEPSNERSQRVAERTGFVREGVLRSYLEIAGRRVDCVVFSLLPADVGSDDTGLYPTVPSA